MDQQMNFLVDTRGGNGDRGWIFFPSSTRRDMDATSKMKGTDETEGF